MIFENTQIQSIVNFHSLAITAQRRFYRLLHSKSHLFGFNQQNKGFENVT